MGSGLVDVWLSPKFHRNVRLFLSGVLFAKRKLFPLMHCVESLMANTGLVSFAISMSTVEESLHPTEFVVINFTV